jgi:hypothetical protein
MTLHFPSINSLVSKIGIHLRKKDYISLAFILLLAFILSQTTKFSMLFDSHIGRALLIGFILVISYFNKILGVISVLLIVFAFNKGIQNYNYFESFSVDASQNKVASAQNKEEIKEKVKEKAKDKNLGSSKKVAFEEKTEGFDLLSLENTMKKSKQSNSVPAPDYPQSAENAEPFSGMYSGYTPF